MREREMSIRVLEAPIHLWYTDATLFTCLRPLANIEQLLESREILKCIRGMCLTHLRVRDTVLNLLPF
jgi:hypothetical protein